MCETKHLIFIANLTTFRRSGDVNGAMQLNVFFFLLVILQRETFNEKHLDDAQRIQFSLTQKLIACCIID